MTHGNDADAPMRPKPLSLGQRSRALGACGLASRHAAANGRPRCTATRPPVGRRRSNDLLQRQTGYAARR